MLDDSIIHLKLIDHCMLIKLQFVKNIKITLLLRDVQLKLQ